MSTAKEIIEDAFDTLEIKTPEIDLEDSEYESGIRRLNRMMTRWAEDGKNLGYTKITDVDQKLTTPDWAEECIVAHLAVRLAPAFGVPITPGVAALASDAIASLTRNLDKLTGVAYPSNLPLGSGNYNSPNTHFFTDETTTDLKSSPDQNLTDGEDVQLTTD